MRVTYDRSMGKRYTLDNELERLTRLAGRLGRRLEYGLRSPRAAGEPEPTILPGQEWRERFGAYERALRTIAHGSSEGVKLRLLAKKASDAGALSDEEFKRGMRELAAESVMEASDADLEAPGRGSPGCGVACKRSQARKMLLGPPMNR
jgi:hypothetical protein